VWELIKMTETKKFSDFAISEDLKKISNINKLENKTFEILGLKFGLTKFGKIAIVETSKGQYRTSAMVLLNQLETIEKELKNYPALEVTLKKHEKGYWLFA